MKQVSKYNTFKGVSTVLTIGTPIVTMACSSDFFVNRPETAISAAGIFTIFLMILIFKNKIMENWKVPSAFVVSIAMLILVLLLEHIILPMKYVCLATMISTGVDEVTFKRVYKDIEYLLPKEAQNFKHLGFLFTSTDKLNMTGGTQ